VALARLVGVTDEQISPVEKDDVGDHLSTKEVLTLAPADELLRSPRPSDALFERMTTCFAPRELIELVLVVGWYWTVGRFMTALDLDVDEAFETEALCPPQETSQAIPRQYREHDAAHTS
jgi:hypothetical protein